MGADPPRLRVVEGALQGEPAPLGLLPPKRNLALVSLDLEDPTRDWPKALRRRLTWFSMARLAEQQPSLERRLAPTRARLGTGQALHSPRLQPALSALEVVLGPGDRRPRKWVFREEDGEGHRLLRLHAFTTGLWEGLELRASARGLERWPALERLPRAQPGKGAWPLRVELKPEGAPALALALASAPLTGRSGHDEGSAA